MERKFLGLLFVTLTSVGRRRTGTYLGRYKVIVSVQTFVGKIISSYVYIQSYVSSSTHLVSSDP